MVRQSLGVDINDLCHDHITCMDANPERKYLILCIAKVYLITCVQDIHRQIGNLCCMLVLIAF